MQKWEYLIAYYSRPRVYVNGREMHDWSDRWLELLNHLGQQGWELVNAVDASNGPLLYFKRPTS